MKRYEMNVKLLREREYYDTEKFDDLFAYARAQLDEDDFDPTVAVVGVTVGSPNLYLLNLTAALVMEGVRLGMGRDELIEEMLDLFDVEPAELEADVDQTVRELIDAQIIREM